MAVPTTISPGPRSTESDGLTEAIDSHPIWTELRGPDRWLGGKQRSTNALGGLTLMGVRLYSPTTGRFSTVDPIGGGNENSYTYPLDPINSDDSSGMMNLKKIIRCAKLRISIQRKQGIASRRAKELVENKHGWAEGSRNRVGHIQAFRDIQTGIRNDLNNWIRCGCWAPWDGPGMSLPSNIWKYATQGFYAVARLHISWTSIAVGAGVIAGIGIIAAGIGAAIGGLVGA